MYDIIFLFISESQINFKVVQILMLPSVGQGKNKLSKICVQSLYMQAQLPSEARQGSYRQVCVNFKDFSRTSQDFPTVFKD